MKPDFFKTQMLRMHSVFGAENYHRERMELIWDQVNDLPDRNFKIIVDHFIGNTPVKYPPLVKDFIESGYEQRKALNAAKREQAQPRQTGLVNAAGNGLQALLQSLGVPRAVDAIHSDVRVKVQIPGGDQSPKDPAEQ